MRLMDFSPSELALLAWSRPISSSLISPSRAFFTLRASPLAFCSASREADMDSMARAWFFLVLLNSSSFSATRLSISCLTCPSSSWARRTLFSSCSRAPVNLLLDLSKLQLGTKDLVLLLLEGAFGLIKSSLQLLLLLLKATPLLVQVVDGAAALAKLVQKILDLISQVLVLALDNVQLLKTLVLGGLQPEQLGGVVATLVLGGSDLGGDISGLGLPLAEHLVEVLAPLLGDESSSVHPLVLHGQVVQLVVHPDLGLLSIGNLGGESVDQLLVLNDLGLQLVAGSLELLNAAHALGLEAGLPQLDLSLGLGESLQGIRLPHGFVLHLLPEVLEVGGHHLVLGQQRRAVLVLSISQSLGVLQLGGDRELALVHVGNGGLQLVDLAGEILVLH